MSCRTMTRCALIDHRCYGIWASHGHCCDVYQQSWLTIVWLCGTAQENRREAQSIPAELSIKTYSMRHRKQSFGNGWVLYTSTITHLQNQRLKQIGQFEYVVPWVYSLRRMMLTCEWVYQSGSRNGHCQSRNLMEFRTWGIIPKRHRDCQLKPWLCWSQ